MSSAVQGGRDEGVRASLGRRAPLAEADPDPGQPARLPELLSADEQRRLSVQHARLRLDRVGLLRGGTEDGAFYAGEVRLPHRTHLYGASLRLR